MNQETGLKSADGSAVSLKSVHIDASVKGLMLAATTQQHYVNKSRRNIEVVYTFPLPAHAVIMAVSLTIGGKKLAAVVMEKSAAEENYEEAIREGDLPVMVERSGPGLYTANLGNLKPREEVLIEVQWAQLLSVVDNGIRIGIPTVIGKRYGDAHAPGGLAAHQSDETDLLAQYPLSFALTLMGQAANANITCPTHGASITTTETAEEKTARVEITSKAFCDRDIVVSLSNLTRNQWGVAEINPDGSVTALASFQPALPPHQSRLALKILVDCSGSMNGDSIEQAKEAVHQTLMQLHAFDYVSYSRFGNSVAHNFSEPGHDADHVMLPATDKKIANIGRLIRATSASMGGTNMQEALLSTIQNVLLPETEDENQITPSLLLITDGDIWNHNGVIRAARNSGHRIFAIGVGSAPAQSLLVELAESSGGAFELVTANESMASVAIRMVKRMRAACAAQLSVDWGATPDWQSELPGTVFDRETLHVFAKFKQLPQALPKLTVNVNGQSVIGTLAHMARYELPSQTNSSLVNPGAAANQNALLARMAASQQLLTEDDAQALQTALKYGLITEQTNLMLVYQRQAADKTTEMPSLEQIKQMAAAGHSGIGSIEPTMIACAHRVLNEMPSFSVHETVSNYTTYNQPTVWRDPRSKAASLIEALEDTGLDRIDIPAFLKSRVNDEGDLDITPRMLIRAFNRIAPTAPSCDTALRELLAMITGTVPHQVIQVMDQQTGDSVASLAILLLWIGDFRSVEDCELQRHAMRLLNEKLTTLVPDLAWITFKYLDEHLALINAENWHAEQLIVG